jgi:hypothetical protein
VARKRELASKLSGQREEQETRPGWRDAITGLARGESPTPGAEREDRGRDTASRRTRARDADDERRAARRRRASALMRKTYLLTPELVDHVADLAESERVGINELVRFLLRSSLELVENGELEIPTQPARRQIVREE